ncbi:hypothetical protein SCP_1200130 [Sparassis crispa]|uniref:Uncharacterized protein n=1 Tax=Sparassis crispa TaxID=139825 RepID=A0A401H081_9APHY|nr:hypothetical protein SCP_1200130 [Sparassis crispa]GBE87789.1 hypothetical protein SCP_1200130 [Sparassis crispa]
MALNTSGTSGVAGSSSHTANTQQGPEIEGIGTHAYYPTNVAPYSSSLSGATSLPSAGPSHSHTIPSTPGPSSGKRRQPDDPSTTPSSSASKRRRAPVASPGVAEERADYEKEDPDVGPNGGPKHWTDQEKTNLFTWILCNDAHWDAFNTKMNTVFRDTATAIFGSRKTFTALKSCFHRNLEVFKQIYALEAFLARPAPPIDGAPDAVHHVAGVPAHFNSATERQSFLESRLEAARAAGAPVGNLNVKVIDHWYTMGWYGLFKNRYQEDQKTGLPVPLFGLGKTTLFADAQHNIDPQLVDDNPEQDLNAGHAQERENTVQPSNSSSTRGPAPQPQPPTASLIPPPVNLRSISQGQQYIVSAAQPPPMPYPGAPFMPMHVHPSGPTYWDSRQAPAEYPPQPPPGPPQPQSQQEGAIVQALDRLTAVSQSLVEACTDLSGLLRTQAAAGAGVGVGKEAERFNKKEKAALATEVLANSEVSDEVRKAAAEYLKRLFVDE